MDGCASVKQTKVKVPCVSAPSRAVVAALEHARVYDPRIKSVLVNVNPQTEILMHAVSCRHGVRDAERWASCSS